MFFLRIIGQAIPKQLENASTFNDCDIPDVTTLHLMTDNNVPKGTQKIQGFSNNVIYSKVTY